MARSYPLGTLLAIVIPISAVLLLALLALLVCCCCLVRKGKKEKAPTGYQVPWYTGFCGSRKPSYTSEHHSSDVVPIKPKGNSSPRAKPQGHMSQTYPPTSLPEHKDQDGRGYGNSGYAAKEPTKGSRDRSARDSVRDSPRDSTRDSTRITRDSQNAHQSTNQSTRESRHSARESRPSSRQAKLNVGKKQRHSRHLSASSIPPSQAAPVPPSAKPTPQALTSTPEKPPIGKLDAPSPPQSRQAAAAISTAGAGLVMHRESPREIKASPRDPLDTQKSDRRESQPSGTNFRRYLEAQPQSNDNSRNESELHADQLPSGLSFTSSLPGQISIESFSARRKSLEFSDMVSRYRASRDGINVSGEGPDTSSSFYEQGASPTQLGRAEARVERIEYQTPQVPREIKRPQSRASRSYKRTHRADSTLEDSFTLGANSEPRNVERTYAPLKESVRAGSAPEPKREPVEPAPEPTREPVEPARNSNAKRDSTTTEDRFASPGNSLSRISTPKYGLDSSDLGTEDYGLNSPFAWQAVEQRGNPLENYERYQTALDLNPKWRDSQEEFGSQRSGHTYATAKGPSQHEDMAHEAAPPQPAVVPVAITGPAATVTTATVPPTAPDSYPLETTWRSQSLRSGSTSSRASSLMFDKRKKPCSKVDKPLPETPLKHPPPAMNPASPDGVIANLNGQRYQAVFPYKPALEDELELNARDIARVYQVFDDGWCFAKREGTSLQGICPKVCLNPI